jgi:hypothetical protein
LRRFGFSGDVASCRVDVVRFAITSAKETFTAELYDLAADSSGLVDLTWSNVSGKPSTFAPVSHASSHGSAGSDPITPMAIGASALGHTHVKANLTDLETITATPTASAVPKGDGSGTIADGWLSDAIARLASAATAGRIAFYSDGRTIDHDDGLIYSATTNELTAAGDIYARGDSGGLMTRAVNHWITPNDHFTSFSGWTWSSTAPFDGAPSSVDVVSYPSILRLVNDDITEDHFAYKTVAAQCGATCRLAKGTDSYVGLRVEDAGGTNWREVRLVNSATAGCYKLEGSGSGMATTTLIDNLFSAAWYLIRFTKNATGTLVYIGMDTPVPYFLGNLGGAWNAARAGLIFGQRAYASNSDRAGLFDWILM